jgi:hypothetical protein
MTLDFSHLYKLFYITEKPNFTRYWWEEGRWFLPHTEAKDLPKYLAAIDSDIQTFCNCLPKHEHITELKLFLRKEWIRSTGAKDGRT